MSLETERKYLDVDFEQTRVKLKEIGASYEGVCFESNILYDNEQCICLKENRLVRLRIVESAKKKYTVFTVKWPVKTDKETQSQFKIREELEIEINNAQIFNEMLQQLGYKAILTYEKLRESWKFDYKSGQETEKVFVDLDRLAFCKAVEIEASRDAIDHVSNLLDLDKYKISTTSYTKLYRELIDGHGAYKISDLLFESAEREALRKSIGL